MGEKECTYIENNGCAKPVTSTVEGMWQLVSCMALIIHLNHERKHSAYSADDLFVAETLCISTHTELRGIFVMQAAAPPESSLL